MIFMHRLNFEICNIDFTGLISQGEQKLAVYTRVITRNGWKLK